jgi:hypothetical protein
MYECTGARRASSSANHIVPSLAGASSLSLPGTRVANSTIGAACVTGGTTPMAITPTAPASHRRARPFIRRRRVSWPGPHWALATVILAADG